MKRPASLFMGGGPFCFVAVRAAADAHNGGERKFKIQAAAACVWPSFLS